MEHIHVRRPFAYEYACLFLSDCLSACLSVCLIVSLSVYVCLSVCLSGWWLSLSRQDDFLHRQGFISEQSRLVDDPKRFASFNAKTLGFVLVSRSPFSLISRLRLQHAHTSFQL